MAKLGLSSRMWAAFAVLFLTGAASAQAGQSYLVKLKPGVQNARVHFLRAGIEVVQEFPEVEIFELRVFDKKRFKKGRDSLAQIAKFVTPNRVVRVGSVPTPNDKRFKQQWQLNDIRAPQAWEVTRGSANVLVAVSDTGIGEHDDLKNRLWTNAAEVPDNGIDDDQNGFVDDVHGWDFIDRDNLPNDKHGHGTHVSGIIGAEGDNRFGITGVNWDIRIMAVKFLNGAGYGTMAGGIASLLYAHRMGARVINASWGAESYDPALEETVEYLYRNGTLVIAAAGNYSNNTDYSPHSPSALHSLGVISVAAGDQPGILAWFTNTGRKTVDLVAPGTNVWSSIPGNQFVAWSGTSMAAPLVTGVAGLMLSLRPDLSVLELRNGLLNAVRIRQDAFGPWISTAGELDAEQAVKQLSGGLQIWPKRFSLEIGKPYPLTAWAAKGRVTWALTPADLATIDDQGMLTPIAAGELTVSATDEAGQVATVSQISLLEVEHHHTGCVQPGVPLSAEQKVSAAFSIFGLPILTALLATRRRKPRRPSVS